MNNKQKLTPYDIAEHEETEALHIVAFGELVPNTPTFAPDDMGGARQYCDVLNTAYNAGAAGKGANSASASALRDYNTMTRNGS